jgi:hypothetical protein
MVRDNQGTLLRTQAIWHEQFAGARIMEMLAIRDGAIMARDKGYIYVILESDAREVLPPIHITFRKC